MLLWEEARRAPERMEWQGSVTTLWDPEELPGADGQSWSLLVDQCPDADHSLHDTGQVDVRDVGEGQAGRLQRTEELAGTNTCCRRERARWGVETQENRQGPGAPYFGK